MPSSPSRLSPVIERFKAWRLSTGLSQSQAATALANAGLPVALRTLQQWEIGQHAPHSVTAAALEKFLNEQEKSSLRRTQKTIAPVIKRLTAWREVNGLSQSRAVEVLQAAGLPARVKTLQAWEAGRNSPQPITAAALEKFLDQHQGINPPAANPNPPPQSA